MPFTASASERSGHAFDIRYLFFLLSFSFLRLLLQASGLSITCNELSVYQFPSKRSQDTPTLVVEQEAATTFAKKGCILVSRENMRASFCNEMEIEVNKSESTLLMQFLHLTGSIAEMEAPPTWFLP